MPSSIWTGAISFGLVQVPVRIVTATRSKDVSFNQLEEGTGARIRYRKVSDVTGDEVPADQIVRGYEVSKGKYVLIEDDEIQSLRPKGSHAIEIEEFVDLDEIDPLYFEQPYYLVPDARGVKPYKLLVEAMTDLNKVAIGRIVMRSKERLVAIRPLDGMLCIETMRYADEVVPATGLIPEDEDDVELTERERTMAQQLVESLASEHVRRDEVPRRVPRAAARPDRAQGRGRRDRRRTRSRGAGEGARPRRRARSVARQGGDREGTPPRERRRAVDIDLSAEEDDAPAKPRKTAAKKAPAKKTAVKKAPAKKRTA